MNVTFIVTVFSSTAAQLGWNVDKEEIQARYSFRKRKAQALPTSFGRDCQDSSQQAEEKPKVRSSIANKC